MKKVNQVDESDTGGTPDIGEVAAICFDPIEGFLNDFISLINSFGEIFAKLLRAYFLHRPKNG